uniref:Uncharacterized protein n=1 Tax=Octactis speculum TaxID=3111310 RepID=A0A7S2DVR4_9STRA|mmetsp:Transcript_54353/g.74282  ORF Transcript_54353/g.74282 Transcript_54353/m.74282 type:complete len:142 (+) Transcript_54353:112-537(+)
MSSSPDPRTAHLPQDFSILGPFQPPDPMVKGINYVRAEKKWKLVVCLLIDIIGFSSFLLPIIGEAMDLFWAPIQTYLLWYMFGSVVVAGLSFTEEILPGTDFIPTATIAWTLENTDYGPDFIRQGIGIVKLFGENCRQRRE